MSALPPSAARRVRSFRGCLLAMTVLICSCASDKKAAPAGPVSGRVWPGPPDEPRIQYLRSIHEPLDIGQSPSFLKRVGQLLTGQGSEKVSLQKPFGLAVDEMGNLCVTDTGANRFCYVDFGHKQWRTWDEAGKAGFKSPVAAVRHKDVFILADSELGKVVAFREGGKPVWEITRPLQRPVGLALAGELLAIVDSQAHGVLLFDMQGKLCAQFGKRGVQPGEFNYPTHITTDGKGHWLVTD